MSRGLINRVLVKLVNSLEYRKTLYTGTLSSGTVSLSDSISNYDQIEITARDNDGVYKTFSVDVTGSAVFTYLDFDRVTGSWYLKSMLFYLSGSSAQVHYNMQAYWPSYVASGAYVIVTKIVGIKHGA